MVPLSLLVSPDFIDLQPHIQFVCSGPFDVKKIPLNSLEHTGASRADVESRLQSYKTVSLYCQTLREERAPAPGPRYQHQRAAVQGHTHYCMTSLNFWLNSETEYCGGLRKACPVVGRDTGAPACSQLRSPLNIQTCCCFEHIEAFCRSLMDTLATSRDTARNASAECSQTLFCDSRWQDISANSLDLFLFFLPLCVTLI